MSSSTYIPHALDGSRLGGINIKALNSHYVNESGDTMRGDLGMNNYQIKNVGEAIDDNDVVNKKQVNKEVHAVEEKIIKRTTNEMESFKLKLTENVLATVELVKKENDNIEKNLKKEIKDSQTINDNKIKELQSVNENKIKELQTLHENKIKEIQSVNENKIKEIESQLTSLEKSTNSDKHFNEAMKRLVEFKKHQAFDIINRKYYEFDGKKNYIFDLITYNKRLKNDKFVTTNAEKTIILRSNQITGFKLTTEFTDFTFFIVFKYIPSDKPVVSNLTKPPIVTGKNEKGTNCGFDNKVVINDKPLYAETLDYNIHVSALLTLGGKVAVFFNEHLVWKDFQVKEGFNWGEINIGGVDAYVYDFIVYGTKMMRSEIKTIINILAKFHNVPQTIIDNADKILKMEDDIKDLKELNKAKYTTYP